MSLFFLPFYFSLSFFFFNILFITLPSFLSFYFSHYLLYFIIFFTFSFLSFYLLSSLLSSPFHPSLSLLFPIIQPFTLPSPHLISLTPYLTSYLSRTSLSTNRQTKNSQRKDTKTDSPTKDASLLSSPRIFLLRWSRDLSGE